MGGRPDVARRIAVLVVALIAGIVAFVLLTAALDTRPAPKQPVFLGPRGH
jgi:hypothetical protein